MSDFGYTFSTDCLTLDDFEHTHTVSQSHQDQTPTITPSASRCHLPTPPKTPSRTKKRSSAQLKTPRKVSLPKTGEKSRALHKRGSSACKGCRAIKRLCTGNWGETCATCARTGKVCEWDGSLKGAKISMIKAVARQMENGSLYESIHTIMATPEPEPCSVTPSVAPTSLITTANAAPIPNSSSMSSPFASADDFFYRLGLADGSAAANPTSTDIQAGFVDSPFHLPVDGATAFTTPTAVPAPSSSSMSFQTTPQNDVSYWFDFPDPNVAGTPSAGNPAVLDDPDFHPDIDPTAFTTPAIVPAPSSSSMSFQTTPENDVSYWFDFPDPNVTGTPSAGNPVALDDSDLRPDIDPTAFPTPVTGPDPTSSSMPSQSTPDEDIFQWLDFPEDDLAADSFC